MKGFVPTPPSVVDLMVDKLFKHHAPSRASTLLDPGCGEGEFISGVVRWCERTGTSRPSIVGIESDAKHLAVARDRFAGFERIDIRYADFLGRGEERFHYIIGNPPYVPITALTPHEREIYRHGFTTARGRFDLYLLFFEQALRLLRPHGRVVFITPEKFLYVETARPLRRLFQRHHVEELHFLEEATFGELVTYPLVTTVNASESSHLTRAVDRRGRVTFADLRKLDTGSWMPALLGADEDESDITLGEVCLRVSCGVATGADAVFVVRDEELDAGLRPFAHPTIAGRQIHFGKEPVSSESLLVPYTITGRLVPEAKLGQLGQFLSHTPRRARLLERTCVRKKPWYAFHENPPMPDVLRPKLLCKDITASPFFVPERRGNIIPRHSVYYLVPADPSRLDELAAYLNSPPAHRWLRRHCQRAANGFLRLQSHVLKRLPLPSTFASQRQTPVEGGLQLEARFA